MKRVVFIIAGLALVIGAGIFWRIRHGDVHESSKEKTAHEDKKTPVGHDAKGHAVVEMQPETQQRSGIVVAKPESGQLTPEVRGYGRVIDPGSLVSVVMELNAAEAASVASSNEWARLKTLIGQGNASERALQTAQAAALRDQIAMQSARDRLILSWGKPLAEQAHLPELIQSLIALTAFLVRIDLPAGQTIASPPISTRLVTLTGGSIEGEFAGLAVNIDPQTQGQGFMFLAHPTNSFSLLPGEAITGYLRFPGEPLRGVILRRESVLRSEGASWIYVRGGDGKSFARVEVALEHPVASGWLVTRGVSSNNEVVVTGAQVLLSEERKASFQGD